MKAILRNFIFVMLAMVGSCAEVSIAADGIGMSLTNIRQEFDRRAGE